ncbi:MAG: TrmH family RNA methyltransferase [Candidatus Limnocylindrales bacterium]
MNERPLEITSPANPRVREVLRLRERRERDRTGSTIVDGAREIRRALEAGVEIFAIYMDETRATSDEARAALDVVRRRDRTVAPIAVSPDVFDRLAYGDRADGLVAVVRTPSVRLAQILLPADPFVAIVEGVEKPGNLGAILRSADGAGLDAIVAADPVTDIFNPNTIRASLGTVFARPVASATAEETLGWLRANGIRVVAARVDAEIPYTDVPLGGPLAIVLGSEAGGLTAQWNAADIVAVRLPMLGTADSLNVSTAAAILFYEALRQRRGTVRRRSSDDGAAAAR